MEGWKDKCRKMLGATGEAQAASMLEEMGFQILERNFRASHKEIDIVCHDSASIRFVEVKTRREPLQGQPWEAVGPVKQRRIVWAAKAYLASEDFHRKNIRYSDVYFDVITIVWNKEGTSCRKEYIPQAFVPIYT